MTAMQARRPTFGSMAVRSVAICSLGGAVVGSFFYVVLTAIWTRSVYGLPWLLWLPFYALLVTVPLGVVYGLAGALAAWLLRRRALAPRERSSWTLVAGCIGALLATTVPTLLTLVDLGPREWEMRVLWTAISCGTGGVCGGLVGWQTWSGEVE